MHHLIVTQNLDLFGGKGNGGKLYGLSLYDEAYWTTLKKNNSFKVGFSSKSTSNKKIHDKDLDTIHDENIHVTNAKNYLDKLLKEFGVKFENLPKNIQKLILEKNAFTFFIGKIQNIIQKQLKLLLKLKK